MLVEFRASGLGLVEMRGGRVGSVWALALAFVFIGIDFGFCLKPNAQDLPGWGVKESFEAAFHRPWIGCSGQID
jgi:hypothetical protein